MKLLLCTSTATLEIGFCEAENLIDRFEMGMGRAAPDPAFAISDRLRKIECGFSALTSIHLVVGPARFTALRSVATCAAIIAQELKIPIFGTDFLSLGLLATDADFTLWQGANGSAWSQFRNQKAEHSTIDAVLAQCEGKKWCGHLEEAHSLPFTFLANRYSFDALQALSVFNVPLCDVLKPWYGAAPRIG